MNTPITEIDSMPTDQSAQPFAIQKPQPYEVVRFNAMKHGILSRYTVLSHESHTDYESLVNSLMEEHLPAGPTEQHLIEELASIIWRKPGAASRGGHHQQRLEGINAQCQDHHSGGGALRDGPVWR